MTAVLTKEETRALRRAVGLLGLRRRTLALSVATGSLSLMSAVALAGVAAWLIARAAQMPDIVALGVAPVAVRLFGISRPLMRYCERLASHDTALHGMSALRTRLYEILAASRADVVVGLRRGDVLARVGADVDAVGDLVVRAVLPMAVAIVLGVSTSLGLGLIHPPAGLIVAVCLLISGVGGPLATVRAARRAELARQEQATDLSATVLAAVEGGPELSVSGRMPRLMEDLAGLERHLAASRDAAARPAALAASIDSAAMGLAVLGNLIVGTAAVAAGELPSTLLAVIVLVPLSAFEASSALGPATVQLVTSAGAALRLIELVERAEDSTAQAPAPRPLPAGAAGGPRLTARDLAVGWPGGPVVAEGISLSLAPGDRLAVVGPSGVGKTTLLLTLAGLLPPLSGTLSLAGADPWSADRAEVAARVTLTAEDAHVFDTTVLENLRVANGALEATEAVEVLERAGLGPWLASLPQGLDTPIGSDATTVSGGERRRLLLARALAAPAPVMLLDEPGEHLDSATADGLVEDLLGDRPARGVLLVTHRLSALARADEVIVLGRPDPAGPARVQRRGPHARLLAEDRDYRWAVDQEVTDRG
ncbi:MAG: thiol reductant ABC exporter subunit CydC [Actinomyces sp.]|uniref:thiol reductant ABC exporter subunit CydC n=1 Tax=Actinomyces sp. TaxID=29317 RepID=UPI0026DBEA76|nr:thiol reductant ABC exporter subunit CydC [Actinomyces sp.]MDO4242657.1 thiol reductant ABC exporter subunit CydC [Actinomyces sp.]